MKVRNSTLSPEMLERMNLIADGALAIISKHKQQDAHTDGNKPALKGKLFHPTENDMTTATTEVKSNGAATPTKAKPVNALKEHFAKAKAAKKAAAAAAKAKPKAKAPAKKAKAKGKPAAKKATTRVLSDAKLKVAKNNTREGTHMGTLMAKAEELKTFTRQQLIDATKSKLTEARARAFVSWSIGHGLIVKA